SRYLSADSGAWEGKQTVSLQCAAHVLLMCCSTGTLELVMDAEPGKLLAFLRTSAGQGPSGQQLTLTLTLTLTNWDDFSGQQHWSSGSRVRVLGTSDPNFPVRVTATSVTLLAAATSHWANRFNIPDEQGCAAKDKSSTADLGVPEQGVRRQAAAVRPGLKVLVVRPKFPAGCWAGSGATCSKAVSYVPALCMPHACVSHCCQGPQQRTEGEYPISVGSWPPAACTQHNQHEMLQAWAATMNASDFTGVNTMLSTCTWNGITLGGGVTITDDVNLACPAQTQTCFDLFNVVYAASNMALATTYDLNSFDHVLYDLPSQQANFPSCTLLGLAVLGGQWIIMHGNCFAGTVMHEMGHNYNCESYFSGWLRGRLVCTTVERITRVVCHADDSHSLKCPGAREPCAYHCSHCPWLPWLTRQVLQQPTDPQFGAGQLPSESTPAGVINPSTLPAGAITTHTIAVHWTGLTQALRLTGWGVSDFFLSYQYDGGPNIALTEAGVLQAVLLVHQYPVINYFTNNIINFRHTVLTYGNSFALVALTSAATPALPLMQPGTSLVVRIKSMSADRSMVSVDVCARSDSQTCDFANNFNEVGPGELQCHTKVLPAATAVQQLASRGSVEAACQLTSRRCVAAEYLRLRTTANPTWCLAVCSTAAGTECQPAGWTVGQQRAVVLKRDGCTATDDWSLWSVVGSSLRNKATGWCMDASLIGSYDAGWGQPIIVNNMIDAAVQRSAEGQPPVYFRAVDQFYNRQELGEQVSIKVVKYAREARAPCTFTNTQIFTWRVQPGSIMTAGTASVSASREEHAANIALPCVLALHSAWLQGPVYTSRVNMLSSPVPNQYVNGCPAVCTAVSAAMPGCGHELRAVLPRVLVFAHCYDWKQSWAGCNSLLPVASQRGTTGQYAPSERYPTQGQIGQATSCSCIAGGLRTPGQLWHDGMLGATLATPATTITAITNPFITLQPPSSSFSTPSQARVTPLAASATPSIPTPSQAPTPLAASTAPSIPTPSQAPTPLAASTAPSIPTPSQPSTPLAASTAPSIPTPSQAPTPLAASTAPSIPTPSQAPTPLAASTAPSIPTPSQAPTPLAASTAPSIPTPSQAPTPLAASTAPSIPTPSQAPTPLAASTAPSIPTPSQAPTPLAASTAPSIPTPSQAPTPLAASTAPSIPTPSQAPTPLAASTAPSIPTPSQAPTPLAASTAPSIPTPSQAPTPLAASTAPSIPTPSQAPTPLAASTAPSIPTPSQAPTPLAASTAPSIPTPSQAPTPLAASTAPSIPTPSQAPTPLAASTAPSIPTPSQAPTPLAASTAPSIPTPSQAPTPLAASTAPSIPTPSQAPTPLAASTAPSIPTPSQAPTPLAASTAPSIPTPCQAVTVLQVRQYAAFGSNAAKAA
ncbi:hypothetical protein QJQ45_022830, partial [Haematococcus lacustris]